LFSQAGERLLQKIRRYKAHLQRRCSHERCCQDALLKCGIEMKIYQTKNGNDELEPQDWKSPQVMALNTFMMLGANYENSKLVTKLAKKDDLIKIITKKTLPYRIYNFCKRLPYYCKDITLNKMNETGLYAVSIKSFRKRVFLSCL
jgi:hypothetical protein